MKYSINNKSVEIDGNTIKFDNIVITSFLGEGANSIVFKGYDDLLERYLAIKVWVKKNSDNRDKYKQALKEAQQLAALRHENIVNIYRANSHNNETISLEMEFIEGVTLNEFMASNAWDVDFMHKIWMRLNNALSYSYLNGIYHGDLHDRNILIAANEDMKIIDFGTSLFAKPGTTTAVRDGKMLLKLFKKLFQADHVSLLAEEAYLSERPEILLNATKSIVFIFERMPTLLHYIEREAVHLAESEAGNMAASIAACPYVSIQDVVSLMKAKEISEHYINVFLNSCINMIRLTLMSDTQDRVKGFHYDETPIDKLIGNVSELLRESKLLHDCVYADNRKQYLKELW